MTKLKWILLYVPLHPISLGLLALITMFSMPFALVCINTLPEILYALVLIFGSVWFLFWGFDMCGDQKCPHQNPFPQSKSNQLKSQIMEQEKLIQELIKSVEKIQQKLEELAKQKETKPREFSFGDVVVCNGIDGVVIATNDILYPLHVKFVNGELETFCTDGRRLTSDKKPALVHKY